MAKRKRKGTRRRRYSKKKGVKKDKAVPLGAAAGALVTGKKILLEKTDAGLISPIDALFYASWTPAEKIKQSTDRLATNAMDIDRYYPLLFGSIVSGSKRIPIVGMVARPADRMLRRLSKGKVSL